MFRSLMIGTVSVAALTMAASAFAQPAKFGTSAEAKAMLEKVVVAMKADTAKTIAQINKGEGDFRDRDLYPLCSGPDGKMVAHAIPERIGLIVKDIKDATGKAYGEEFIKVAAEGKFAEVSHMILSGDDDAVVQMASFVTKVAGHTCMVGYYK